MFSWTLGTALLWIFKLYVTLAVLGIVAAVLAEREASGRVLHTWED